MSLSMYIGQPTLNATGNGCCSHQLRQLLPDELGQASPADGRPIGTKLISTAHRKPSL
jgi:hypothetical protein